MIRNFEPAVNKTENEVSVSYNVLYDKEKAEQLRKKCDDSFAKKYDTAIHKLMKKCHKFRSLTIFCVVITFVLLVLGIFFARKSDVALAITLCGLVAPVVGVVVCSYKFSGFTSMAACERDQYKRNDGIYTYPLLVSFHNFINGGELVDVKVRDEDKSLWLRVDFAVKNDKGIVKWDWFGLSKKYSTEVTVPTIDFESQHIYYPFEEKKSFNIVTTIENSAKEGSDEKRI